MQAIHPKQIREIALRGLQQLGATAEDLSQLRETLLLKQDRYYGRTFRTAKLMAAWLDEIRLMQFYHADGSMLHAVDLSAAQQQAA